jgi:hypothetical protein
MSPPFSPFNMRLEFRTLNWGYAGLAKIPYSNLWHISIDKKSPDNSPSPDQLHRGADEGKQDSRYFYLLPTALPGYQVNNCK